MNRILERAARRAYLSRNTPEVRVRVFLSSISIEENELAVQRRQKRSRVRCKERQQEKPGSLFSNSHLESTTKIPVKIKSYDVRNFEASICVSYDQKTRLLDTPPRGKQTSELCDHESVTKY
jgi:hypothetical protein